MRLLLSILLLASLSAVVQAQPADISPTGVSGHHVGETASAFLAASQERSGIWIHATETLPA